MPAPAPPSLHRSCEAAGLRATCAGWVGAAGGGAGGRRTRCKGLPLDRWLQWQAEGLPVDRWLPWQACSCRGRRVTASDMIDARSVAFSQLMNEASPPFMSRLNGSPPMWWRTRCREGRSAILRCLPRSPRLLQKQHAQQPTGTSYLHDSGANSTLPARAAR
jgi:hypothetical protein